MPALRPLSAACTLPALARTYATAPPTPNTSSKDHHIVTYTADAFPAGFAVAGTHAGVKKKAGALDLGLLISTSDQPASAAACMTRNVFKAAPVTVTADLLHRASGHAKGFVVNSGCANAVTGKKGLEDAWSMSNTVTELAGVAGREAEQGGTLVMSTGVIGQNLPIDSIVSTIPKTYKELASTPEAWMNLAKAFMTTDTFPKLRTKTFTIGGKQYKMAGIDKGAGMIAPNMGPPQPPHATLLGVIATDASVEPESLQKALQYATDRSFNSITVDGDMSTNDTILALANGAAAEGVPPISESETPEQFNQFKEELKSFAAELAQLIVRDGEGATKFVTVRVINGPSFEVANAVARSVASSSLVKTAMYGEGRFWHARRVR